MRAVCGILLLLSCALLGCSKAATIGGLCPDCDPIGGGQGADASDACAAGGCGEEDAGPVCVEPRLDLMLVVDNTASISPWWGPLYEGLVRFIQDSRSSGIGVGLQSFDEICDGPAHRTPLVPIAPLPGNADAFLRAIPPISVPSTSTNPALEGSILYARDWSRSHPDSRVVVLLLTDASPGSCDGAAGATGTATESFARAGYETTPSIKTYVVGFSVLPTPLLIATAGGTELIPISVAPLYTEVQAALERVRDLEKSMLTSQCTP